MTPKIAFLVVIFVSSACLSWARNIEWMMLGEEGIDLEEYQKQMEAHHKSQLNKYKSMAIPWPQNCTNFCQDEEPVVFLLKTQRRHLHCPFLYNVHNPPVDLMMPDKDLCYLKHHKLCIYCPNNYRLHATCLYQASEDCDGIEDRAKGTCQFCS